MIKTLGRSSRQVMAVLALASAPAGAADRCTLSDLLIGVPDGPAEYLGGGPVALTAPQVHLTTVLHSVGPAVTGSAAPASSAATPGSAAKPGSSATPASKLATRPPPPEPQNDQERLFAAVHAGDLAQVQQLLRSSTVDVNAPSHSSSRTSLIDVAASDAREQIARALIDHGARVRGSDSLVDIRPIGVAMLNLQTTISLPGQSGAFDAVPKRSPQDFEATIHVLLDAGADADGVLDPTHPQSALSVLEAMPRFDGDLRIAKLLLDHGAQLGASTPGGSPLAVAVAHGRDEFLDLVLDGRHVDPSGLDAALAPAVARRDAGIAARLLAAGASPNAHDQYGRTLFCATLQGGAASRALALLFLEHGARSDLECVGGPPLNLAIHDRELALLLLEHGADPNRTDRHGATALNLAVESDHALLDALLAHGARLGHPLTDETRSMGPTNAADGPTVQAIMERRDYLATRLLQRDGLQTDTPCAAVLYAASLGASGTLAELLRRGADPNSTTDRGVTALMTAAYHSDTEALRTLLAQPRIQVDATTPTVVNIGRFVPLAEGSGPLRTGHRTALMYAAVAGSADSCKLLLQHGASVRETDAEGRTAIDYAKDPAVLSVLKAAQR